MSALGRAAAVGLHVVESRGATSALKEARAARHATSAVRETANYGQAPAPLHDAVNGVKTLDNPKIPNRDFQDGVEYGMPEGTVFADGKAARARTKLQHIDQGWLGDCYLLSAMGALASRRPQVIQNMVQAFDHGVVLNLPDGKIAVDYLLPLSKGTKTPAYAASSGDGVLWPAYIEKGIAAQRGRYRAIDGGYAEDGFKWLTGVAPRQVAVPQGKVINDIERLVRQGDPVLVNSRSVRKGSDRAHDLKKDGVVDGHVFVVDDVVNTKEGPRLKLWNPWGEDHPELLREHDLLRDFDQVTTPEMYYYWGS